MKIILNIIWNKGSWKDFTCDYVRNNLLKEISKVIWPLKTQRFAFADLLKREYISYFNELMKPLNDRLGSTPLTREFLEQHKEFHRENLQKWGDWRRGQDLDYFLNNTLKEVWEYLNMSYVHKENVISIHTDCRFKNEYDRMQEFAKQKGARIINIRILGKNSNGSDLHISERELLEFPVDYELKNDYSPKFIKKVEDLFRKKIIPSFSK